MMSNPFVTMPNLKTQQKCPYAYKPHSYNSCYSKENNNDDNKKYLKYDLAIMLSDLVESKDKGRFIRNIEDKAAYLLIYQIRTGITVNLRVCTGYGKIMNVI